MEKLCVSAFRLFYRSVLRNVMTRVELDEEAQQQRSLYIRFCDINKRGSTDVHCLIIHQALIDDNLKEQRNI